MSQAYKLVGLISQDEERKEHLVDELLSIHQPENGGLIGGLHHVDDGDIPQMVEASVASLNSIVSAPEA